eukprot:COSAG02_NODE_41316_length_396_cov_0.484848_1_plen_100_part_01
MASSKHGKKQASIERKAAVQEVHAAIREVSRMVQLDSAGDRILAGAVADDWAAMQVRCCALLSDLAQYKAAENCLGDVEAKISSGSTPNPRVHFELARAA